MPQRHYISPLNSSDKLVVKWQRRWRICLFFWNGKLVGIIPDLTRLPQKRKSFRLPDDSTLSIDLFYTGSILFDFNLFINDKPLLYRENIARSLTLSYCTIIFVSGVNFIAGLFYLFAQLKSGWITTLFLCLGLSSLAFSGIAAIFISGTIYLILALLVWKRSWQTLATAILLNGLDSAYLVFTLLWGSGETAALAHPLLFSRLIILIAIAVGLKGFEKLRAENSTISNLAPAKTLKVEPVVASILSFLIDPISWIFNRIDQNNR